MCAVHAVHAVLAGNWNLRSALELRWTAGDVWVANVQLPVGGVYEYKYVLIDYDTKQVRASFSVFVGFLKTF